MAILLLHSGLLFLFEFHGQLPVFGLICSLSIACTSFLCTSVVLSSWNFLSVVLLLIAHYLFMYWLVFLFIVVGCLATYLSCFICLNQYCCTHIFWHIFPKNQIESWCCPVLPAAVRFILTTLALVPSVCITHSPNSSLWQQVVTDTT